MRAVVALSILKALTLSEHSARGTLFDGTQRKFDSKQRNNIATCQRQTQRSAVEHPRRQSPSG